MTAEALRLVADDGVALGATLFRPPRALSSGLPRRAVLVAGALGVDDQRFYAPFAEWLAQRGCLVMTFDLRGIGASRAPEHARSLRGLDIDLLGWARLDFAAAVAGLGALAGGPVTVVGHSLGAHHAGMTGALAQSRITRLVAVAAGAGSWRDWAAPSRRLAPLMLLIAIPVLTPWFGYFPGRRLRMVGDCRPVWCGSGAAGVATRALPGAASPGRCCRRSPTRAFRFMPSRSATTKR